VVRSLEDTKVFARLNARDAGGNHPQIVVSV
jgi:hypothetical protein